jgi:predicted MFS family arabinose efflux permease
MIDRRFKNWLFVIEALGSLACGFYGEYFYFMLRDRYGFSNFGNLSVSAIQGLIFAVAAWQGGKFAQRFGYVTGLRTGLVGMTVALVAGGLFSTLPVQLLIFMVWTAGMCFVSPAQEALISHGESVATLPRRVGIFNVVWASCSAISYFLGGAVFEYLGRNSIYWLPAGMFCFQLLMLAVLVKRSATIQERSLASTVVTLPLVMPNPNDSRLARSFVRMAWIANPFACIGINSMLAMIPSLAQSHHLSTPAAGFFCSIWFFGRLISFVVLQRWNGWHYRFRWLLVAFVGLISGFITFLVASSLWFLLLAQVVFGLSAGLIYYSSLFYSMDVNDRKGEHGGVHEALMGIGNCIGPFVGAASLIFAPQIPNACAYAVSALMTGGLAGMLYVRVRGFCIAVLPDKK